MQKKAKKQKNSASRSSTRQQQETQSPHNFYAENTSKDPYNPEPVSVRYQPTSTNVYSKTDNSYAVDSSLFYADPTQVEYQPHLSRTVPKPRTIRPPKQKQNFETAEPAEEYLENRYQSRSKYQSEAKYATEDSPYFQSNSKYLDESAYRQPTQKLPQQLKYEDRQIDVKNDYMYVPAPRYQERKSLSSVAEPEVRPPRYLYRSQQHQEESRQLPHYQLSDQTYQQSINVPVIEVGPRISYRQDLKNKSDRFYRKLGEPVSSVE